MASSSKTSAPGEYRYTPHHAVFEMLREKVTLPCPFNCEKGEHDLRLPVDNEPPGYWEYHEDDNDYKTWTVTRDCSVKLTNGEKTLYPDDSVFSDVEIPSRILDFFNPSACPHGQVWHCNGQALMWYWRDEITAIINTLKQKCNKPGFRIFTNETCGMHVHIGRDKSGLNLDTAKNLMGVFLAFERCFDSLLTVDRIAGYEDDHAALPALKMVDSNSSITSWTPSAGWKYSLPLSVNHFEHLGQVLMTALEAESLFNWKPLVKHGASIPYWLHRLSSTTTFAALGLYSTAHQSSVNLEHLIHNDTKKPTVEIRLHPGTLEVSDILAWIDFLCNLSVYAEGNSTTAVFVTLESMYADPSLTIVDIARLVNASSATIAHYTNLLSPGYANQRFRQNNSAQPKDSLTALYTHNLTVTAAQTSASAVSARITQKLISGRYGQFPLSFLKQVLPEGVKKAADKDAKFLNNDMDKKGLEDWSSEVESVVGKALQRKSGLGY